MPLQRMRTNHKIGENPSRRFAAAFLPPGGVRAERRSGSRDSDGFGGYERD